MRMVEAHEQGNRRGTCGWITSFLRSEAEFILPMVEGSLSASGSQLIAQSKF